MSSHDISSISTRLVSYFYSEHRTSFKFSEESYDRWTFLACVEGNFQYEVDGQKGEARVGELVVCPPGVTLYRKALSMLSFHFAVFDLYTIDHNNEETIFPYIGKLTWRNTTQLLQTLDQMKSSRERLSKHYTEHLINNLLYQIVIDQSVLPHENKASDPAIQEAVRYINEYAYSDISMQAIAEHIGLSQSQFTRKFQKQIGITPNNYLTDLRLQKVRKLLTETDDSLEQIAEQCGYQNAFYLSRVFTKKMDMNPSHYRRTHRV